VKKLSKAEQAKLMKLAQEHAKELAAIEARLKRRVTASALKQQKEILGAIAQLSGTVDQATRARIAGVVNTTIKRNGIEAVSGILEEAGSAAASVGKMAAATALLMGRNDLAKRTLANLARSEATGQWLKSETANRYAAAFAEQWEAAFGGTQRGLAQVFTRAAYGGLDWRDVSRNITGGMGDIKVPQGINPATFAEAFARTKVAEIANESALENAQEGGMELFINVGVVDERQSEECYDACNAGAMTLAEWEASDYGVPPRHEFNCRCDLVPVPFDPELKWENKTLDERRERRDAAE